MQYPHLPVDPGILSRITEFSEKLEAAGSTLPPELRMHAPGHRGDLTNFPPRIQRMLENLPAYDLSAYKGIASTRHGESSAWSRSQEASAEAEGAQCAAYMTGGATSCVHATVAMLKWSTHGPILFLGEPHISAIHIASEIGLPVLIEPTPVDRHGISTVPSPEKLGEILSERTNIGTVWATIPYEGSIPDLLTISQICQEHDVRFVLDISWCRLLESVLGLEDRLFRVLPRLTAKINSSHKDSPVFGQNAVLFLGWDPAVGQEEFWSAVTKFRSTSASTFFLASLVEGEVATLKYGSQWLEEVTAAVQEETEAFLRSDLRHMIFDAQDAGYARVPYRIIWLTETTGRTGYEWEDLLYARRAYPAYSAYSHFVGGFGLPGADAVHASFSLIREIAGTLEPREPLAALRPAPELRAEVPFDLLFRYRGVQPSVLPAHQAAGHISSDTLAVYPPGRPNIIRGQVVNPEMIEYVMACQRDGSFISGLPATVPPGHVRVWPLS